MSLYRTIIPKYTFIPYDFPTSRDGKYHCLLDDGQILRSRREQLGLSVYQVAEMAGIQFSQYQRLESGERFFSGCSMKIGLSVCAVLLLDPFEFFDVNVKQPKPDIMMPHEVFDGLQDDMPRPKKVGRKPIRRDIMTVYFNHPSFSIIIPREVLVALGKPAYIQMMWNLNEKRLLLHVIDSDAEQAFDIPPHLYDSCTALAFPRAAIFSELKEGLGWDTELYAAECRIVYDKTNELFILCDLNTAQKSEKIVGPFAIPTCIDDGMDDDEILDEDGEENEEL